MIAAFPDDGGSYAVAKTHLGASLAAAASLVLDYVLNVAVAVTAGMAALTSAFPALYDDRLWLCLAVLALITGVNLRGIVESAKAFIAPTVVFVGSILVLIAVGLFRSEPVSTVTAAGHASVVADDATTVGALLLLAAFSSGCAAERRSLGRPIAAYVRGVAAAEPGARVTLLIPADRARAAAAEPAGRGRRARRTAGDGRGDLPTALPAPVSQARQSSVKAVGRAVREPSTADRSGRRGAFLSSSASPNLTPGVRDGRSGLRRHRARGVRAGGSRRQGGDEAVTTENIVGLVVAVSLLGYLVLALIFPERF